jgi:CDP-glucose 4,6-dehydratase
VFWQNKKVVVTGSEGLMGKPLCEKLLAAGAQVFRFDLEKGHDIRKLTDIRHALPGQDICIHLAALSGVEQSRKKGHLAWEVNIEGTWNVLQAALEWGIKSTVIASSNHVYGHQVEFPVPESAQMNQLDTYSVTKICADYIARAYAHNYGLPVAVIRNTNCFGPNDPHDDHIIPGTIKTILAGGIPTIRSNGHTKKGYLYVEDVVDAYMLVAEELHKGRIQSGEAFNVGTQPISVQRLVDLIWNLMDGGSVAQTKVLNQANDQSDEYLDTQKIRALGWVQAHRLEEGLSKTIEWFQERAKVEVAV